MKKKTYMINHTLIKQVWLEENVMYKDYYVYYW
jgi:hypothetical protein